MVKRTAEHQLTQLNQHDEDDSSDYQGSGFQRANESEISRRVIKKPKSRLRSANSNTSDSAPKPAFTGFGGLGPAASGDNASVEGSSGSEQPTAASSFKGFSFGKSTSSASETVKPPAFGSTSFGSGSTAFGSGSTGTFKFGSGQAAAKPTFGTKSDDTDKKPAASGGFSFGTQTKSGFTFGKASTDASESAAKPASTQDTKSAAASSFSFPAFKPPTQAPALATDSKESSNALPVSFKSGFVPPGGAKPEAAKAASTDDDEFYRHIRGLNVSIQNKINDAIAVNAFVDLTPLLEQYSKHWKQVTQDYPLSKDTQDKAAEASSSKEPSSMFAQQLAQTAQPPAQNIKPADPPKFSFGASSAASPPKPATGATGGFSFSFGKPPSEASKNDSSEAKKPFSFGFGKLAEKNTSPVPASTQKPTFSFGFGKPAEAPLKPEDSGDKAEASVNDNDAQSDNGEEAEEESKPKAPTTAGEEGETTVHSTRCKVYMWDNDKKSYKDLGVGNLRINTWDGDNNAKRARVLCRQETTEKITLNASMFAKMMVEFTENNKSVGLLAVVDGKPTRYMLRVKTVQEAQELNDALKKVIASL
ncbi:hypothetical protein IWW36_001352 [Coemansia brasiliensis]|uniref:RanBD1 domain-containing protein n=1 Tax=Coemansia brasiliensis TaxID=2650707 RepID=A0A9W8LZ40_9FUNG|nr:hypothetical protein IWW36_001352 [Coemansia brasiliensis]